MAEYKLDINFILTALDNRDMDLYHAISSDADFLKEFNKNIGWLIPQWFTASNKEETHAKLILEFNEICNIGWSKLDNHPELRAKLLALCGTGKKVYHKFYKPTRYGSTNALHNIIKERYPDIRDDEITMWIDNNTVDGLRDIASILGTQDIDLDKAIKEFEKVKNGRKT